MDTQEIEEYRRRKQLIISKMLIESRTTANKSQDELSDTLCVSKRTVQNWESGISCPDIIDFCRWFEYLQEEPISYILDLLLPAEKHRQDEAQRINLINAIRKLAIDLDTPELEQLYFIAGETHGSSFKSLLHLFSAHCHTSMKSRVSTARLISQNFELDKALNELVTPDVAIPDFSMLVASITGGESAVANHQKNYFALVNGDLDFLEDDEYESPTDYEKNILENIKLSSYLNFGELELLKKIYLIKKAKKEPKEPKEPKLTQKENEKILEKIIGIDSDKVYESISKLCGGYEKIDFDKLRKPEKIINKNLKLSSVATNYTDKESFKIQKDNKLDDPNKNHSIYRRLFNELDGLNDDVNSIKYLYRSSNQDINHNTKPNFDINFEEISLSKDSSDVFKIGLSNKAIPNEDNTSYEDNTSCEDNSPKQSNTISCKTNISIKDDDFDDLDDDDDNSWDWANDINPTFDNKLSDEEEYLRFTLGSDD